MRSRVSVAGVLALTLVLLAGGFGPATAREKPPRVDLLLTILHNNDGESALLGDEDFGGVARFKSLVDDLKHHGSRVREMALADGTPIVTDGAVVPGPGLNVATIDFLARGGDQYPFRGASFTTLGITYQQALQSYIETTLAGLITAAQYPSGGEGRITRLP